MKQLHRVTLMSSLQQLHMNAVASVFLPYLQFDELPWKTRWCYCWSISVAAVDCTTDYFCYLLTACVVEIPDAKVCSLLSLMLGGFAWYCAYWQRWSHFKRRHTPVSRAEISERFVHHIPTILIVYFCNIENISDEHRVMMTSY